MKNIFGLLLVLPLTLWGALTFESHQEKKIEIVRSLDINPSFLNDSELARIYEQQRRHYTNHRFFTAMDNAYLFIPTIKNILSESDIPDEFLFLAMAESSFLARAYSHKQAAGLWQFLPSTAELYRLRIDEYVDERLDLFKSTRAAAKYLTYLHKRFGKWYLAALAYNCGEGRLRRAIEKAGSDELGVLLDEAKRYLPRESRNYIRKIVALALLGTDEKFLIESEYQHLLNRGDAYSVATVEVPRGERLSRVASMINMPFAKLKRLNAHLKYDFVPPHTKTYDLYIPYVKLAEFKTGYTPTDLTQIYRLYTVKPGDNLGKIGRKFGVRYKMIKDFNQMKSDFLSIGQKLIVPSASEKLDNEGFYVVRSGDTLISIARAFKVTVADIRKHNNLDGSLIRIGDKLSIYD